MLTSKKFWLGSTLTLCLCLGIIFHAKQQHRAAVNQFSIASIQFTLPNNPAWDIRPLTEAQQEKINDILLQRFTYLGKGARSFAFLSEDGQYVLKFFKYRYHTPHWAVRFLPSFFPFTSYKERKMKKVSLDTVLTGYKIAYDHDPEGTGLIHIHLNPRNTHPYPTITITDKQIIPHSINLDHTRFVLQRKVQEFTDVLDTLLKTGNVSLAKQRILQVFDLYLAHYQKGLYDLGLGILRNNGFIDDQPIHFDVGKMTLDSKICDPHCQYKRLMEMTKTIDRWLLKNHPRYYAEISKELTTRLCVFALNCN